MDTANVTAPPPFDGTLASLVWPADADRFMREFWQRKPLFSDGGPQRLRELARLIDCEDVGSLLALSGPAPIEVLFTNAQGAHEQLQCTSVDDAREHFERGRTLYFHIDQRSRSIRSWIRSLAESMGLPNAPMRASVFAGRCSSGIAPHFDANENFTIQLSGSKTWLVAPNQHVHNPTTNYFIGDPPDAAMRAYVHQELPTHMPAGAKSIRLQAGSMLYLPAGHWHATQAVDEIAVSLNIVLPRVVWADVFLQSVRPILLQDPRWRARADDLIGNGDTRERAITFLNELIPQLAKQLQHFADFLVPPMDTSLGDSLSPKTLLQRNPLVAWCVYRESDEVFRIEFRPPLDEPIRLRVAPPFNKVCEWIGSRQNPFTYSGLCREFAEEADGRLSTGVLHLLRIGFVQHLP